jgi:two-component system response regulator
MDDFMQDKVILLVEDNPDDELLTLRALRQNKLANEIVTVRDGVEALDYLFATGAYAGRNTANVPQLILLDLKLPRVDGFEVLRRVRTDANTEFVPVVVLTSSDEDRDIVESYHLRANSYVRKPVDFLQFTEAIRQIGLYWLVINKIPGRPS